MSADLYGGKGTVSILSNQGLVVADSQRTDLIGQPIKALLPESWEKVLRDIQSGHGDGLLNPRTQHIEVLMPIELGRSEEHTSELQSLMRISYAVFCLTKKK